MFHRLWRDETGSVGTAELIMIMTIMTIGVLVGLKSFRDATVTEFADLAQALANLDQTYSYSAISIAVGDPTVTLTTVGSWFEDAPDFCDTSIDVDEQAQGGNKCINVAMPADGE
jgi:Flp pilus assembly pilin Flp